LQNIAGTLPGCLMSLARWSFCIIFLAASACSTHRYLAVPVHQAEMDFKDHIGLVVYDPVTHKTIYEHQGDRYFTPASNIKILTFYTALTLLGDSIPALRYVQKNDSLIFWGTGDPGFLYAETHQSGRTYQFLKYQPGKLFFSSGNFQTKLFGPGWAWDDYQESYQVERTPFPIYGNRSMIRMGNGGLLSVPPTFTVIPADSAGRNGKTFLSRGIDSNQLTYSPGKNGRKEWKMPFHYSEELLNKLLTDTLKRDVGIVSMKPPADAKTLYSVPADSLYKVMMQTSDNFIAEQLLMMCAAVVSDTLKPEMAIQFMNKNWLQDLPDAPIWVDGSGLSRYNLLTPRLIVRLWDRIYDLVPHDRLFSLLAAGGESGTIRDYYKGERRYILGKTGTLANNHSLSGYLVTKTGRTLIFSWMNNNFTVPAREVRARMEMVLKNVYENY
jgi:D-alanyl-D-alanine carboxypeptidase/D-alanyl-D-alanine-endopeptidase (penicillin-binding protein 4)